MKTVYYAHSGKDLEKSDWQQLYELIRNYHCFFVRCSDVRPALHTDEYHMGCLYDCT
jgi:hypothetical protein